MSFLPAVSKVTVRLTLQLQVLNKTKLLTVFTVKENIVGLY